MTLPASYEIGRRMRAHFHAEHVELDRLRRVAARLMLAHRNPDDSLHRALAQRLLDLDSEYARLRKAEREEDVTFAVRYFAPIDDAVTVDQALREPLLAPTAESPAIPMDDLSLKIEEERKDANPWSKP